MTEPRVGIKWLASLPSPGLQAGALKESFVPPKPFIASGGMSCVVHTGGTGILGAHGKMWASKGLNSHPDISSHRECCVIRVKRYKRHTSNSKGTLMVQCYRNKFDLTFRGENCKNKLFYVLFWPKVKHQMNLSVITYPAALLLLSQVFLKPVRVYSTCLLFVWTITAASNNPWHQYCCVQVITT